MRLSEYASTQRTYGSRKVPRSVQQSIPIDRIYEDGTWCCGNVYSQMWSMPDINFTMSDEDNKAKILNLLGKVYMGVPSDCWLKICIVSQRMDEKSFRENVLLHRNLDGLDLRASGFAIQEPKRPDDGKYADTARSAAHKEVVI